MKNALMFP